MDEGDRDRSFPDGRCHALDIAASRVADGKDPRQARLEEIGWPGQRPMGSHEIFRRKIGTRLDESLGIERDASLEPARIRHCAGHDEYVPEVSSLNASTGVVAPAYALEVAVAFERHLDMEELSTRTKLGTMQNTLHGALAVKQHFQTDVAVSSAGDGKAIGVPPIILVER